MSEDVPAPDPTAPAVELEGVGKAYEEAGRRHAVLEGLDVTIARGERVAVLGPSGSGKSTLLNLVSGIDHPDRGRVRVAGIDLGGLDERRRTLFRRARIGFVFQFFNLVPTLTALENLLLPLDLLGVGRAEAEARGRALLDRVGLGSRAGTFPDRLSGGEQQRVAVARAVVHRPGLVLADEPTGNLDEDTSEGVVELLEEVVSGDGRALLVVTHARELAARMDRTLLLDHGRVRDATHPA